MSHARFSPSSASRWIACPGSIAAQEALGPPPEDDSSPASREGTAAHGLLETCLVLGVRPEAFIGNVLEPGCPPINQSMINGVNVTLDYVDEYTEEYGADNLVIIPERKVVIGPMIGLEPEECSGTSDIMIAHKDFSWLTSVDYKNGRRPVDANDNPQLMLYTAGGVYELREAAELTGQKKFKKFRNVVAQPNAGKRRTIEIVEFGQAKLTTFLKTAEKAAAIAKMDGAPRSAGSHCEYCRAKNNCQTYRARARAVAADEFGEIADPETIPDDELEAVLDEAEMLQAWINGIKARALKLAVANPATFVKYKAGFGPRRRTFDDIEDLAEWCRKKKIPEDVFMPRAPITPTQLEAELRRLGKYPKAKRGEDKPESPIEHLVKYSTPNPTLKKRTDGDAPPAEQDFDNLDTEDI